MDKMSKEDSNHKSNDSKVRVAVRVRPLNEREIDLGSEVVVDMMSDSTILYPPVGLQRKKKYREDEHKNPKTFRFDYCFWSIDPNDNKFADQSKVFQCLGHDVIESAFKGYNASIIAYGQTGSGKSYTMMGRPDNVGIIPRLCNSAFQQINSNTDPNISIKLEVSYMEIYNEKVKDLLDVQGKKKNLRVREHKSLGPYVDGLSQLLVRNFEDVENLMNEGNKSRTVAMTNMNSESSRSHAVFNVIITQTITDPQSKVTGERVSKLSLVDLAGSERAQKTGAVGERLKEGASINKSLTTLMIVVSALADSTKANKFVPYRDSVLTWLLKDCLGGNSKTVMVATLSPAADNYEETLSTLRYADRAKRIVNHVFVNEDPNAKIIRELREEVERLRKDLLSAKELQAPELKEKLEESENLMMIMNRTWEEKLQETERIHKERQLALEKMGVCINQSGIQVTGNKYFIVNLSPDPSLSEMLVYYIKENIVTHVGSAETQDIQLNGLGIKPEHSSFEVEEDGKIYLVPKPDAKTLVNGEAITERRLMYHGDRILWGMNHFFRMNCPLKPTHLLETVADYNFAQQEVMKAELPEDPIQNALLELERQHAQEKAEALAIQRQEYEQKLEALKKELCNPMSGSMMNLPETLHREPSYESGVPLLEDKDQFMKSCANRLLEQVSRARLLTREANFLAAEMNKVTDYSVTLQIPPASLSPNATRGRVISEPAILVRRENKPHQIWSMSKFENKIIDMRELYEEYKIHELSSNKSKQDKKYFDNLQECTGDSTMAKKSFLQADPFFDIQETHSLIGVANIYLNCLFHNIKFRYNAPILNQHGETSGKLLMDIWLQNGSLERPENYGPSNAPQLTCSPPSRPDQLSNSLSTAMIKKQPSNHSLAGNEVSIGVRIVHTRDLPPDLAHFVFCQYLFYGEADYTVAAPVVMPDTDSAKYTLTNTRIKFDHTSYFVCRVTEEFLEHLSESALSIEVYGNRASTLDLTPITTPNNMQFSHQRSDRSNLKQGPEIINLVRYTSPGSVSISNSEVTNSLIYNDQSRSSSSKPVPVEDAAKKYGDRWVELYRRLEFWVAIEELNDEGVYQKVEVQPQSNCATGGIYQLRQGQSRRVRVFVRANKVSRGTRGTLPLICDSIQEISVGSVMSRPRTMPRPLDSYQEEDLNILRESWANAVTKRQDYLNEQLNKIVNKAGKTVDDEEREANLMEQWMRMTAERDAVLLPVPGSGIPGAPANWSPPPGMELHSPVIFFNINADLVSSGSFDECINAGYKCTLPEEKMDDYVVAPIVKVYESLTGAVGQWDASLNNSIYLNRITSSNDLVYVIVKVVVRLSHPFPVNLVLRKRICINIYRHRSITNFFKKQVSKYVSTGEPLDTVSWTGVTYQIVSSIPQASLDIEDRENLARMAASQGEKCVGVDGESYFMKYMRSLYAVEMSLYHDRLRQALAVKEVVAQSMKRASPLHSSSMNVSRMSTDFMPGGASASPHLPDSGSRMKRFISVPNFQGMSRSSSLSSLTAVTMSSLTKENKTGSNLDLTMKKLNTESNQSTPNDKKTPLSISEDRNATPVIKSTGSGPVRRRPEPPKDLLMVAKNPLVSPLSLQPTNSGGMRPLRARVMGTLTEEKRKEARQNSESEDDSNVSKSSDNKSSIFSKMSLSASYAAPTGRPFDNLFETEESSPGNEELIVQSTSQNQEVLDSDTANPSSNKDLNVQPVSVAETKDEPSELRKEAPTEQDNFVNENFSHLPTNDDSVDKEDPLIESRGEQRQVSEDILVSQVGADEQQDAIKLSSESTDPGQSVSLEEQENGNKYESDNSMDNSQISNSCSNASLNDDWRNQIGFSCLDLDRVMSSSCISNNNSSDSRPSSPTSIVNKRMTSSVTTGSGDAPRLPQVGQPVLVLSSSGGASSGGKLSGWVRFVGGTRFAPGTWVGVELEQPEGKNDGSVKDIRYFGCKPNYGIFVRPEKLIIDRKRRPLNSSSRKSVQSNAKSARSPFSAH